MKKSIWGVSSLLMSVVEILVGILLLIDPVGFTSSIIVWGGILLAILGTVDIVKYFLTDIEEAAVNGSLGKGILLTLCGLFCVFKSEWFLVTFPILAIVYGVIILITGVAKLQNAVNMVRAKHHYWFVALIGAALTLLAGILVIANPFSSTAFLWTFAGISLLVEAVADILTYFFSKRN